MWQRVPKNGGGYYAKIRGSCLPDHFLKTPEIRDFSINNVTSDVTDDVTAFY